MTNSVQAFRDRLVARGQRRVELCLSASDADLIRRVAKALLNDDEAAKRLREALQDKVPNKVPVKFKDWLAAFPEDDQQ